MNPLHYTLLSVAIFTVYLVFVVSRYGLLASFSDSYYKLPDRWKFLFYFTLLGTAIPLMIATSHWLMFLAGIAICYTGAAAGFKDDPITKSVHFAGVFIGFPLAMLYLCLIGLWIPVAFTTAMSIAYWFIDRETRILFIEVLCYYTIIFSLLLTQII